VNPPAFRAHYERRVLELRAELTALDSTSDDLSKNRGLAFLAFAIPALVGLVRGFPLWAWGLVALPLVAFVVLVVRHLLLSSKRLAVEDRLGVVTRGLARIDGTEPPADTTRGPDPFGERFVKPDHPNAGDLDLFGKTSVFRALSRAETSIGEETLAKWLLTPAASVDEIRARQEAARELMGKPELVEEIAVRARRAESRGRTEDPLVAWAEAPAELAVDDAAPEIAKKRAPIVTMARLFVPLTLVLFFASPTLAHVRPILGRAYLAPFALQLVALGLLFSPISRLVTFVTSRETPFGRFGALFTLVEDAKLEAPLLVSLQRVLRGEEGAPKASVEIARLERIIGFADLRHNTLIHVVANLGLLYDLWCALALERWRQRSGRKARAWLRAVGTLEALASLATYAAEHPEVTWPEVVEGEPYFEVSRLAHPLLDPKKRVSNSLTLDGPGQAILVTGSNMSGKSTWLRSMGLCAVMANAGSAVCAEKAKLARMQVWTSMRIRDSLEQGVSHFYAELLRLKAVQDAVHRDEHVLFLLDEILHGTNSRERTAGARSVVLDLSRRGAIGAVSSHDLGLVGLEAESGGTIRNRHFSDKIEAGTMKFDYRLEEGVVRSTNALRLMRLVGLAVDDEGAGT
jgi:hypothetical protein